MSEQNNEGALLTEIVMLRDTLRKILKTEERYGRKNSSVAKLAREVLNAKA